MRTIGYAIAALLTGLLVAPPSWAQVQPRIDLQTAQPVSAPPPLVQPAQSATQILQPQIAVPAEPPLYAPPSSGLTAAPQVVVPTAGAYLGAYRPAYTPYLLPGAVPTSPEVRAALQRREAEYLTNGAAALSVPSSGPGEQYFTNGAAVLSTPTTSAVPPWPVIAPEASPTPAPTLEPTPMLSPAPALTPSAAPSLTPSLTPSP